AFYPAASGGAAPEDEVRRGGTAADTQPQPAAGETARKPNRRPRQSAADGWGETRNGGLADNVGSHIDGQARQRTHHRAVDADELKVAADVGLDLARRMGRVPAGD